MCHGLYSGKMMHLVVRHRTQRDNDLTGYYGEKLVSPVGICSCIQGTVYICLLVQRKKQELSCVPI